MKTILTVCLLIASMPAQAQLVFQPLPPISAPMIQPAPRGSSVYLPPPVLAPLPPPQLGTLPQPPLQPFLSPRGKFCVLQGAALICQ